MHNLTDNVILRDFRSEDSAAVILLWERCGLTRAWNDPGKDIQRKCDEGDRGGTGWFWVAEYDGQIIGAVMAGYDGHRGSVNYLAVAPEFQGYGVGRAMMRKLEAGLKAAGCPKLNVMVRTTNSEVRAFYERLGYVTDDVAVLSRRLIVDQQGG